MDEEIDFPILKWSMSKTFFSSIMLTQVCGNEWKQLSGGFGDFVEYEHFTRLSEHIFELKQIV